MITKFIDKIICGDCVEVVKKLPCDCIDATITSPPYDALRDYEGYAFNHKELGAQLFRVTKPGGVVVWVVGDATVKGSETGTSFRHALGFMDAGFKLFDTMIYEKTGTSFPSNGRYTQIFEYMFVFSKGAPNTFNPICDIPKFWEGSWGKTVQRQKDGSLRINNSKNCGKAKSGRATDGRYGYKQRTNIWKITNGKNFAQPDGDIAYGHPATFPFSLAKDHILTWTKNNDIILDPMCGAATTCLAAMITNRKFIGIDCSNTYCNLAIKRLTLAFKRKKEGGLWEQEKQQ
jgi:DNA modification methylase